MISSLTFAAFINVLPRTLKQSDHIIVRSKINFSDNEFLGSGNKPDKNQSVLVEEKVDVSVLYDDNAVIEMSNEFVHDCNLHMNNLVEKGNIIEAQEMFYLMIEKNVNPDVVTHTTLIKGYIKTGNTKRMFELFKDINLQIPLNEQHNAKSETSK